MIYEEPKVDVIEFAEGEIFTTTVVPSGEGGNIPGPQNLWSD